jgi:CBS domain-containing protein
MDPAISTTALPRIRVGVRATLEETAKMLTQSGEERLGVIDDEGRMAGVVDIRQIVRAIAPPEPTPVVRSPIPSRRLIPNDDTLTQTVE